MKAVSARQSFNTSQSVPRIGYNKRVSDQTSQERMATISTDITKMIKVSALTKANKNQTGRFAWPDSAVMSNTNCLSQPYQQ